MLDALAVVPAVDHFSFRIEERRMFSGHRAEQGVAVVRLVCIPIDESLGTVPNPGHMIEPVNIEAAYVSPSL